MDKWNERQQYCKGQEGGIGNTLLEGTCITIEEGCYLKMNLGINVYWKL